MFFDIVNKGNEQLRKAICLLLVKLLYHQHDTARRHMLAHQIIEEMAESPSCQMRKTYAYFCGIAVQSMTRAFFTNTFFLPYLQLATDKIASVRQEFINALLYVKPFMEYDTDKVHGLVERMDKLMDDKDNDVAEIAETIEFKLL